jgi:hypothetical protein
MGLEGVGCENEKWIEVAHDHVQWPSSKIRDRRAPVYVRK